MKRIADTNRQRRLMRRRSLVWLLASALISAFSAQAAEVHSPPLGFHTVDTTPQTWAQLKPDYRFTGKVGDTLKFGDVEDIWVLRCFMHVLNNSHIAKTVENAIPPEAEFLTGNVPENLTRYKEPALLTVMFKTRRGEIGVMNIYSGMTIIELNSRYGAVVIR